MTPEITIKIYKSEPYAEIIGINEVAQHDMEMIQKIIDIVGEWIKAHG